MAAASRPLELGFVRVLTAQRRDASGVDILRGLSLRRIGDRAWDALWGVHATHVAWASSPQG